MDEILRAWPARCGIAERVEAEAIYIERGGSGDDAEEKDLIFLKPLIDEGLLTVQRLEGAEEDASFVDFAGKLDDGEAETLAIALHRRLVVATDDRKATRVAGEPGISVVTTLEIVRHWTESSGLEAGELRQALIDLRRRGRYFPSRSHPLRSWWEQHNIDE